MQTVRIEVATLKRKIEENKTKHVTDYQAAVSSWQTETAKLLKKNAKLVLAGALDHPWSGVDIKPTSHEDDYSVVLKMLECEHDSVIELTQMEFRQYMMDEWGWKHAFTASTTKYLKS